MICLLGLMFDDSAVIKRSKLTCAPTPPSVKTWLQLANAHKDAMVKTGLLHREHDKVADMASHALEEGARPSLADHVAHLKRRLGQVKEKIAKQSSPHTHPLQEPK